VLRIDAVEAGEGSDRARIGEQTLQIPPRRAGEPPPRWVQFSPGAVLLSRADVEGLSARNHLRGVVRRIVDLPESTFVAVDVGQTIWAEVTPQAVRDLQLEPGAEVTCLIKTHSLKGAS
jgi:molybdopterin-binding protein